MQLDQSHKDKIQAIVTNSLSKAQSVPTLGLDQDSSSDLANRVLQLVPNAKGWQIHVASQGLQLSQKIALEKLMLEGLHEAYPQSVFGIYFRRVPQDDDAAAKDFSAKYTGNKGPAPLTNKPAPFGLKMKKRAINGVRDILVVASGKGGVGKSTVSANLAVALSQMGQRVGLLDADVYGPSGPTLLGLKGPLTVNADGQLEPLVAFGVKTVSFGFLSDAYHPVIWRGPLVGKAIEQLCYEVNWAPLDILIIDLPPGTGDVQLSLIENLPLHGALIVSTPQDVALIDAHKALTMFQSLDVPVLGLVENMTAFSCSNCGHVEHIFGEGGGLEFAQQRNIPVLAQIPLHPSIRMASDAGQPISLQKRLPQAKIFADLANKIIGELAL